MRSDEKRWATLTATLFVNHFKSMRGEGGDGGRRETQPLRQQQADTVRSLVLSRFGSDVADANFAILGDFNDYLDTDEQGGSGIDDLVRWDQVENVTDRLPPDERWTHYWKGADHLNLPPAYQQLDYLLLSRRLARLNPAPPQIERAGQPGRASRYAGPRLEGIGRDRPKASDHCPVSIDLRVW